MAIRKFITKDQIEKIQSFYDLGNSLNKCEVEFGWSRGTLVRYLRTRSPAEGASIENKKRRNVENVVAWRKRVKRKLVEYKGGECEVCGYNKCIEALEFHHNNPSKKDFSISGTSKSFETLKIEVDKCKLVCSNCHKEIHVSLLACSSAAERVTVGTS